MASAVQASWVEVFGVINKNKQVPVGKLVAALKRLSFDYVFDTYLTADPSTMRDAWGGRDVDVVLTSRVMVRLFRSGCIVSSPLAEDFFDSPLGTGNGAVR